MDSWLMLAFHKPIIHLIVIGLAIGARVIDKFYLSENVWTLETRWFN